MKTLTPAQAKMLRSLLSQHKAAADYPGAYSPGLQPGTAGCHKAVAASLVRLGLVDAVKAWYGGAIDINALGRAAIAV